MKLRECTNCGYLAAFPDDEFRYFCANCGKENILHDNKEDQIQTDKIFTLAYTNYGKDEHMTLLINEYNKTIAHFYTDGYEGISMQKIKGILNFLGVKYFECVYDKMPENIATKYKEYDWRNPFI